MSERLLATAAALAGGIAACAVLAILALLLWLGLPLWRDPALLISLAGSSWNPAAGEIGLASMAAGTLLLAASALLLAYPCGLLLALSTLGLAPRPLAAAMRTLLALLSGIPTVVYAFVSVWLLVPWLRDSLGLGMGYSWLAAALTLGVMLTPTVALLLSGALSPTFSRLQAPGDALGLSRVQLLLWVVLPSERRALLSALLLSSGRAVGDTLIALMVSGNAIWLPANPTEPLRALTAHIAITLAADTQSQAYAAIYAASLLLLAYVTLVHVLSKSLSNESAHRH
ncbi:ABC transporter permease subunit [Craterilacuibacter sp. RT1T]|uniref:PstC family ABC transporter permease n=1 Tax=Craterilacuibacter sp. RT1T TaxID=2942211 RepID=UPI0020BE99D0|nr:ABC transporter permease subunit [Craterilacuibacter sp. RT1T]MCL6261778.1 ABC transporter permease subunit [Craterilacuibacter sp. RT1T]